MLIDDDAVHNISQPVKTVKDSDRDNDGRKGGKIEKPKATTGNMGTKTVRIWQFQPA